MRYSLTHSGTRSFMARAALPPGAITPPTISTPSTAARAFVLKLTIPAGAAAPTPPIGPALGQRGIKAIDFCRQFNEASARLYAPGTPARALVTCRPDRTFALALRPPPTCFLLKRAAGIAAAHSQREVARLPVHFVLEVARTKAEDPALRHVPLRRIFAMVVASAKSYGISIT